MKRILQLLAILLLLSHISSAQTRYKEGYIVKANGEKVNGLIAKKGYMGMSKTCTFKDADGKTTDYLPEQLKQYKFASGRLFVTKEYQGEIFFMECLFEGAVNIYYARRRDTEHYAKDDDYFDDAYFVDQYFIDKEGMNLSEIPYEEGVRYIDDTPYAFKSTKHQGILHYYMSDAPGLDRYIEKIVVPKHGNLIALAEKYHEVINGNSNFSVNTDRHTVPKLFGEITIGGAQYRESELLAGDLVGRVNMALHVKLIDLHPDFYFKTGLMIGGYQEKYRLENNTRVFISVPAQLEYIYPRGAVRPRVAYGFNFNFNSQRTVLGQLGANIKVKDKIFASLSTDFEYLGKWMLLPGQHISSALQLGLYFHL